MSNNAYFATLQCTFVLITETKKRYYSVEIDRVSMAQGSGISIFSSKEQEYEQKAQLLKRLAFVILCSETDQYHKYMPEIQGEY